MTGPRVIDWEKLYDDQRGGQSAAPAAASAPVDWEAEFERQQRASLPSLAPVVVTANPPTPDAGTLPPVVVSDTARALTGPKPNRFMRALVRPTMAPGVPSVAAEATRVGPDQYPGHYEPGLLERGLTLPLRLAAEAGEHPIDFATGLVTAPIKAAITANRAAAEQEAANDVAMSGGRLGPETNYGQATTAVARTVAPPQAAQASAQVAATLAAPVAGNLFGGAASSLASRLGASEATAATVGRVAGAVGHPVSSGATLAAFTPNDPVAGFIGGALLGTPWSDVAEVSRAAAAQVRPRVAQVYDLVKSTRNALSQGDAVGVSQGQRALDNALASLDPQDIAYAVNDPHFGPIFRTALQRRGVDMPPAPDVLRGHLEALNAADAAQQKQAQFAANVEQSTGNMMEARRQRAIAANPPQPPEPFTPKPLPAAPSLSRPVQASDLTDYADTHKVPVQSAARAFQEAGNEVPDEMAKTAIAQYLSRGEAPIGAGMSDIEVAQRTQNAAEQLQRQAAFPMTVEHLLNHSEAKGTTIPESADILRRAGYTVPPELERAAQVEQMRRGGEGVVNLNETPTADEIREQFGETFSEQRERALNGETPPPAPAKPREKGGIVLDEDGIKRFADARTMAGSLRPVGRVSTEGLVNELLNIDRMQEGAEQRAQYRYVTDENAHTKGPGEVVVAATRKSGGATEQAKAARNMEQFKARRDAIFEELQRRGLDQESIYDRYSAAQDRAVEREGLTRDAKRQGRSDEFVTDEAGNVLFTPDRETGDLFGQGAPRAKQESLFGEQAGTAASRNLRQTESASRAELSRLAQERAQLEGTVRAHRAAQEFGRLTPAAVETMRRSQARLREIASRQAELERLVNRGNAITPDELSTRAQAEQQKDELGTDEQGPDQGALFSPAGQPTPLGARIRQAMGFKLGQSGPVIERVKSLGEISRNLADMVDVPLRQGRFLAKQRRAVGAFFPQSEVTRVVRFDKLDTAAHEVAHYISKEYLKNPTQYGAKARGAPALTKQMKAELVKMGRDLYGSRKPNGGYGEEGIAQWGRFYVTDPARLAADAPAFSQWMEQHVLAKEPALKAAMDQAQRDFADYKAAPSTARVDAMIQVRPEWRAPLSARTFSRSVLDDLVDIREAVNELGGAPSPIQDAYVLARLTRGAAGVAEEMVERGVIDPRTGQRVTRGFAQVLEDLKPEEVQPFRRYLAAERALELHARGIDPGIARDDALDVVNQTLKNSPHFQQLAEDVWKISHALIDYREAKGLLTSQEATHIKQMNQRRVGFYRVFDDDESAANRGTGKGLLKNSSGVKSIKGSARQMIDPLQSLISDHYETVKQAHAAEVGLALADLAEKTEGGGRIAEVLTEAPKRMVRVPVEQIKDQLTQLGFLPPNGGLTTIPDVVQAFEPLAQAGAKEAKDLVLPVVRNGKRVWLQIGDKGLYEALQGLGTPELPLWLRAMSIPTRTLRAGATLTLEFIGRNPMRDAWTAAIFSKAGFRPPGFDFARGLFHAMKQDDLYQEWKLNGGDSAAMLSLDRSSSIWPTIARTDKGWTLQERTQADRALQSYLRSPAQRAAGWVMHPIDSLRMLSALFENATRIGEYAGVREGALRRGASRAEAATEAALASRDVTIDFARAGAQTRIANQLVAFLNANIQGLDKLGRELRERPQVVLPRIAAAITIPSVALYLLQRHDPAYQEVPTWQKNLAWVIVQRDHEGKVAHIWRIPKPPELGILFGSVPERILEWMDTHDPHSLDEISSGLSQLNPIHLPEAIAPLVEWWANKNAFTGRKIVPDALSNLPASEQATQYTGEAARAAGRLLNLSPAKLENTVRGYAGGLGQYGLDLANYAVRGERSLRGEPPLAPATVHSGDAASRVPFVRGLAIRQPGFDAESIQRTLDDFQEADAVHRAWRRMLETGDHAGAAAYLAAHRDQIQSVMTKEEGGPGPLRAAYERITQAEQTAAKGGRLFHDPQRTLDLAKRMQTQAVSTARQYRGMVPR